MTTSNTLTRFLQVSILAVIFISPLMLINGNPPIHNIQEQSFVAAESDFSIILMIGDGMGYEHIELARLVEEGANGSLDMQHLTWNASAATYSASQPITDSAAAATAIATGVKTFTNYVSVDSDKQPLETILEYAQTLNKSTGVVSTTTIVHATPACFMAHTDSRNNYEDIVEDIVYDANVTVLLGGGTWRFSSSYQSTMASNGYTVVHDRAGMLGVTSGKLLGLFSVEDMDYEAVRDYSTDPSLLEMTNQSLHILSQDPDGFFLMVEGGRIDHAGHANNPIDVALETIEFEKAVECAIDYVDANPNTILIVTADHETGGLTVVNSNLGSVLPADLTLESDKRDLRMERADNVTVTWTSTGHTDADVPIFCYGDEFSGLPLNYTIDNIDIYTLMKDYYQGNPLNVTEYIPETTTTTDTTTDTTSTTDSTTTTTTSGTGGQVGFPLDPMILAVAGVGAAVVVVVILIIIKKR